jgi:hypothetical protein
MTCENNEMANPNKQYGISVDVGKINSYRSLIVMGSYFVDRTNLVPREIDLATNVGEHEELLKEKMFITSSDLQGQLVLVRNVFPDSVQRRIQIAVELEENKYALFFVSYYEKPDNLLELEELEAYVMDNIAKSLCKRQAVFDTKVHEVWQ